MLHGKTISLVIPTLNEEGNMPTFLKSIPDYIDEIIVVDGGSSDLTAQIAEQHGCQVYYDNRGKGSALIKGVKYCKGEYIIMIDADWSHRVEELRFLIRGLELGYDVCMGSRFIQGGGSDDMTIIRQMGNKFFVMAVNALFAMNYSDLCYGYRAFNRNAISKLNLKCRGFGIETEISIKAAKRQLKVLEVPSFEKKRKAGEPKLRTFADGWKIIKVIAEEVFSK